MIPASLCLGIRVELPGDEGRLARDLVIQEPDSESHELASGNEDVHNEVAASLGSQQSLYK